MSLTRDPIIVSTNRKGDTQTDGSALDFTPSDTNNYSGKVEVKVRTDTNSSVVLTSGVTYYYLKGGSVVPTGATTAVQREIDGLRLEWVTSAGADGDEQGSSDRPYYKIIDGEGWTTTVDGTQIVIRAIIDAPTASANGLGPDAITFDKVLDINRAREGAKAYEAKLTNDAVVLPTSANGLKKADSTTFDADWAALASGNMDVWFAGSKYDDAGTGVTYSIKNEDDRTIASSAGYTTADITASNLTLRVNESTGAYVFLPTDYTGWNSDAEEFTLVATVANSLAIDKGIVSAGYTGASITIEKVYTVSKARQGVPNATVGFSKTPITVSYTHLTLPTNREV